MTNTMLDRTPSHGDVVLEHLERASANLAAVFGSTALRPGEKDRIWSALNEVKELISQLQDERERWSK